VHTRAVGRHWSGDIWISTCSKDKWDHLIETAHRWLPNLSGHLHITPKTYPILVHGIPTSFETSRDSDDIAALLDENCHLVHPSMLQHAEFISWSPQSDKKTHTSLILYLTSLNAANDCIKQHISYCGCLHSMVQFICYPPQCYNCHHFSHFAQSCRSATTCGLCSAKHATHDC
ncbi:hypothetical protein K439DRAFT_1319617, partial [Ramaria rubella]